MQVPWPQKRTDSMESFKEEIGWRGRITRLVRNRSCVFCSPVIILVTSVSFNAELEFLMLSVIHHYPKLLHFAANANFIFHFTT